MKSQQDAIAELDALGDTVETFGPRLGKRDSEPFALRRKIPADRIRIVERAVFQSTGKVFYTEGSPRCWQVLGWALYRQGGFWSVVIQIQQIEDTCHGMSAAAVYGTTTLHSILAAVA